MSQTVQFSAECYARTNAPIAEIGTLILDRITTCRHWLRVLAVDALGLRQNPAQRAAPLLFLRSATTSLRSVKKNPRPNSLQPPQSAEFPKPPRGLLRTLVAYWSNFWFAQVPAYSLAAFRILFGVYLLCYFLSFAPKVNILFSNQGIYSPFLIGDWALPPLAASLLYGFTLMVIGSFILGYRTRFTTPLLLGLYLYYYFLNLAVKNTAYDRLNLLFLFMLCFGELNRVWSIRLGSPRPSVDAPLVSIWAIRLITIQVCFLYFGAGLWKLWNPNWHTGEMMKQTLIGPWGTSLAFGIVNLNPPMWLYTTLTWGVIAFELAMPVGLFVRRLQPYAFGLGLIFHISVALLLNIPEFLNCVTAYVLFVKPETVRDFGNTMFRAVGHRLTRLSDE